MRRKMLAGIISALALAVSAPLGAYAVGGPNEAGNSGKFHPKSPPCEGGQDHDHKKCPGPH